jgi:hypothetical protein
MEQSRPTRAGWCFPRASVRTSRVSSTHALPSPALMLRSRALRGVSKHEDTRMPSSRPVAEPHSSPLFTFQTAHLVPAAQFLRPGLASLLRQPESRMGGAPRDVRVQRHPWGVHITRHARRLARRLASHDAGRSPLGAPPWRILGSGAALLPPAFAPDRSQRAPRTQVIVPGGRGPEPPGASGYEPPPQDATPRSAFRIVSRTRPQ